MKKISIVLPVSENQSLVEYLISSLLEQTHQDWECILVSRDGFNYKKLLASKGIDDERIRLYFLSEGVSKAYAYGLEKSKGVKVVFADCRELYDKNRLRWLARSNSAITVDGFNVIEGEKCSSGLPNADFSVGYVLNHYVFSMHKPSIAFERALANYVGVSSLLEGGKGEFYKSLLRENDGAEVIAETLYERLL